MYLIKCTRVTRGQIGNLEPYIIGRFTRVREARGQCRHQRNSLGLLLLEKYNSYKDIFDYQEIGENHYMFTISDLEGIVHEAHVWMEVEDEA